MNNIHPTLCLGHLQGTRASSSSAIIAIYVRFLLPSLWDNLWSLTFVQSLVLFYVLSFVEWDQNVQAVAKETDHRIIQKKFFLPPLVQYPKKKNKILVVTRISSNDWLIFIFWKLYCLKGRKSRLYRKKWPNGEGPCMDRALTIGKKI